MYNGTPTRVAFMLKGSVLKNERIIAVIQVYILSNHPCMFYIWYYIYFLWYFPLNFPSYTLFFTCTLRSFFNFFRWFFLSAFRFSRMYLVMLLLDASPCEIVKSLFHYYFLYSRILFVATFKSSVVSPNFSIHVL